MAFTIRPAQGSEFINREKEPKDIISILKDINSSLGFALYGKRRIGKTSLFKETKRILEKEKNIVPVYYSLWDLVEKDIKEFTRELGAAIIESYRPHLPLEYKAKELFQLPLIFLKKVIARLNLSLEVQDSLTFIFSFDKEKRFEPGILIDEVFALPEKMEQGFLLGLGFDSDDGHKRISRGENFYVLGGSKPTHEMMRDKCIKFNEELNKRHKSLDDLQGKEFYEIARKIGLRNPKDRNKKRKGEK